MHIDRITSQALARDPVVEQKACWRNCVLLLAFGDLDPALLPAGTVYVEGWALLHDFAIVFEHGWLETPDGRILDPTMGLQADWDTPPENYHAGARYTAQALRELLIDHGRQPPFVWGGANGYGGMRQTGYKAAYDAAHRQAYGHTQEELIALLRSAEQAAA